jgi:hypothetical protein
MVELTVIVVAAGGVLLAGFALGARFAELNLRARENRLARQRRELTEATDLLRLRPVSGGGARHDRTLV